MTQTYKKAVVLPVFIAGLGAMVLLVGPSVAQAQRIANEDGHKYDANNQVGSGGRNGPSFYSTQLQNNQNTDILTGNVSGLNYFHGNLPTFNGNVFQGRVVRGVPQAFAGPSDYLNAVSAPVNYLQRTTGASNYTQYFVPQTYTAPVPQNLVPTKGGNAGLTTAPPVDPLVPNTDIRNPVNLNDVDPNKGNLPLPGELDVAGPVDPTGAATLYSMSPLYGVRQMENNQNNTLYQANQANQSGGVAANGAASGRLSAFQIQQMRSELNQSVSPGDQNNNSAPDGTNLDSNAQLNSKPITDQVASGNVNGAALGGQPGSALLQTGQGLQNSLLIPPAKQSKQIKALEEKFAKLNRPLTPTEQTDKYNAMQRALHAPVDKSGKKPASPTAMPGMAAPSALPPGGVEQNGSSTKPALQPILTPQDTSPIDNQPTTITSLATGIDAKGLADLMKSAEEKMRQGKFTEAVDTYETALAVAPNNPFAALGRSFAELGASYYGKADQDLTRAIISDPSVLAGKYDLNGFLGADRVNFVTKDLADIASHEKSGRPLMLLGFISHNLGDDTAAGKYLDQAAPRGGYDSMIVLMRSTWQLKSSAK